MSAHLNSALQCEVWTAQKPYFRFRIGAGQWGLATTVGDRGHAERKGTSAARKKNCPQLTPLFRRWLKRNFTVMVGEDKKEQSERSCSEECLTSDVVVHEIRLKKEASETAGRAVWRVVNGLMTTFFLMACGVQFNDPDPYLWVPLYGTAALLTLCVTVKPIFTERKWWRIVYTVHALFSLGMFVYVVVELAIAVANSESGGTLNPLTYEEGRELAGIMITTIWLFTCRQSPSISSGKPQGNSNLWMIGLMVFSILPIFLWILCYSNLLNDSIFSLCTDFSEMRHLEEEHHQSIF